MERGWGVSAAGMNASLLSGIVAGVATCPFDVVKTCMAGDVKGVTYRGIRHTAATLLSEGQGWRRLFAGVTWRTINITGTVYLANECRVRLAPHMFPHAQQFHQGG